MFRTLQAQIGHISIGPISQRINTTRYAGNDFLQSSHFFIGVYPRAGELIIHLSAAHSDFPTPAKTAPPPASHRACGLYPTHSFGGIRISCPAENLKKYLTTILESLSCSRSISQTSLLDSGVFLLSYVGSHRKRFKTGR